MLYGIVCYSLGFENGKIYGSRLVTWLFIDKRIMDIDDGGNFYRITDSGNRGETFITSQELHDPTIH